MSNDVLNSMSWRSECQTEQYRSRDSAIARSTAAAGTSPRSLKLQLRTHHTRRRLLCPLGNDARGEPGQRVPAFSHDIDDVGGHAASQSEHQHLHR